MARFCAVAVLILFFIVAPTVVHARTVEGVLLNDDDPYIVESDDGTIYRCEWLGGSNLFNDGDRVLLTNNSGYGDMIGLSGLSKGKKARISIEEK